MMHALYKVKKGRCNIFTRSMIDGVHTAGMVMDMNMGFGDPRIWEAILVRIA